MPTVFPSSVPPFKATFGEGTRSGPKNVPLGAFHCIHLVSTEFGIYPSHGENAHHPEYLAANQWWSRLTLTPFSSFFSRVESAPQRPPCGPRSVHGDVLVRPGIREENDQAPAPNLPTHDKLSCTGSRTDACRTAGMPISSLAKNVVQIQVDLLVLFVRR